MGTEGLDHTPQMKATQVTPGLAWPEVPMNVPFPVSVRDDQESTKSWSAWPEVPVTVQVPDALLPEEEESGTVLRQASGSAHAEDFNSWQTSFDAACPQACEESSDASPC